MDIYPTKPWHERYPALAGAAATAALFLGCAMLLPPMIWLYQKWWAVWL